MCKTATQKIDKTKILMTNGSLMKVESITKRSILRHALKSDNGIENHFFCLFRVAVIHRFCCTQVFPILFERKVVFLFLPINLNIWVLHLREKGLVDLS